MVFYNNYCIELESILVITTFIFIILTTVYLFLV